MANQSNQLLLPNSFRKFFESFFEAYEKKKLYDDSCANSSTDEESLKLRFEWDMKMKEFDLKYPVSDTLKFVQQHLDVAGKFATSSEPSSSFQVVNNILSQMAEEYGCGLEDDVPVVWKMLMISIMAYENSTNTPGMILI